MLKEEGMSKKRRKRLKLQTTFFFTKARPSHQELGEPSRESLSMYETMARAFQERGKA